MGKMSVAVKGFSMTMGDFRPAFKNHFKYMKSTIQKVASGLVGKWAYNTMVVARYLAPASGYTDNGTVYVMSKGSSLANSIVMGEKSFSGNVISMPVGVDIGLWHSNYPKEFKKIYKKNPPWGVNPQSLALFIHEYWDKFTANKPMARKRALDKQAKNADNESQLLTDYTGSRRVGEKFLYRAAKGVSSPRALSVMARAEMLSEVRKYGVGFKIGAYQNHQLKPPMDTSKYTFKPSPVKILDY